MKKLRKTLEVAFPLKGILLRCQSKESLHKAWKRAIADDPIWERNDVTVVLCKEWSKKHFRRGIAFRSFIG